MPSPFLSVVIPALDEERFLPGLLSDLSHQTMKDFEVIVVDGGSKDRTVEKTKTFEGALPSLQVLQSERANVSVQRNTGGKLATGTYLLFFDADTRIPRYFLEGIHYNLMKKQADVFTCWAVPDKKSAEADLIIRAQNIACEGGAMIGIPYATGGCLGFRTSIFQKSDGFNPAIRYMEDAEITRRLDKAGHALTVFRDPMYICSMRRFRKEGTLKLIAKLVPTLTLSMIDIRESFQNIPHLYPMNGGAYYKKRRTKTKPTLIRLKEYDRIFRKLLHSRKKKIQQSIQSLTQYFLS